MKRNSKESQKDYGQEEPISRTPLESFFRHSKISDCDHDSAEEKQTPKHAAEPAPFKKCLEIIFVEETPDALNIRSKTGGIIWKDHAKRARAESEEACIAQRPKACTVCQPAGICRQR